MQSEYFLFDGVQSSEMGLYIVRFESGFIQSPYIGGKSIKKQSRKNDVQQYFFGVEKESIEFTIQVALLDNNMQPREWTPQERFKIGKWLFHDTCKEFQTADDLGKRYYGIFTNDINTFTLNNEGYVELTFETNSNCAWSPTYIDEFDLSDNPTSTIKELENRSNVLKIYKPKMEIQLVNGETNISIKNLSNSGKTISFTDLIANELISIDNKNKIILSDMFGSNPFSKKNKNWLELVYGINSLEITGRCIITFKSIFPIAQ